MTEEIEQILLVKNNVYLFTNIPPRASARGFKAADWNLSNPDWTGRLRCVVKGEKCELKLEDKMSGQLFGVCPVEAYPGTSVEPVVDSSRYFVICLQDSGRKAYIGMGFADRSDSFDLNVCLQDHFRKLKMPKEDSSQAQAQPNLDLAFKEGQTIRINIPKRDGAPSASRSQAKAGNSGGLMGGIPPPPGGAKIGPPPPGPGSLTPLQSPSEPIAKSVIGGGSNSNVDLLGDLLGDSTAPSVPVRTSSATPTDDSTDLWGDFASATPSNNSSGNWVKF